MIDSNQLTTEEIDLLNSKTGLYTLLKSKKINLVKTLEEVKFITDLKKKQEEFIKLQNWVIKNEKKWSSFLKEEMRRGKAGR